MPVTDLFWEGLDLVLLGMGDDYRLAIPLSHHVCSHSKISQPPTISPHTGSNPVGCTNFFKLICAPVLVIGNSPPSLAKIISKLSFR